MFRSLQLFTRLLQELIKSAGSKSGKEKRRQQLKQLHIKAIHIYNKKRHKERLYIMSVKNKTMSQRKAEFVTHFMRTRNATESAKLCGYSEKSAYNQGYRLMKDDEVIKMLTFEQEKTQEKHLKEHEDIIERLKEEALGDVVGHTGGSRIKALELLMKFYGMIDEKQKLEVNMKENGWFESLDFIEKDSLN